MSAHPELIEDIESYIRSLENKLNILDTITSPDIPKEKSDILKQSVYEWVLVNAFIDYEKFLSNIFKKLMIHESTVLVNPKDEKAAREILVSFNKSNGERFLDWTDPKRVREKSVSYLGKDNILEKSLISNIQAIGNIRLIRNQISHDSIESRAQYKKVIESILPEPYEKDYSNSSVADFLSHRASKGAYKNRIIINSLIDSLIQFGNDLKDLSSQDTD